MTILERIFPSLKPSNAARQMSQRLTDAYVENAATNDMFISAVSGMIEDYDRVRTELAHMKREKRARKYAEARRK